MSLFNGALECVERRLAAAEVETSKWPTVGDVFIKQLQVDIDRTTVVCFLFQLIPSFSMYIYIYTVVCFLFQ